MWSRCLHGLKVVFLSCTTMRIRSLVVLHSHSLACSLVVGDFGDNANWIGRVLSYYKEKLVDLVIGFYGNLLQNSS